MTPLPVQTPAGIEPAFDLAAYYPLLIFSRSSWAWRRRCSRRRTSHLFPFKPQKPTPRQADAVRVGHGPGRRGPDAVRRQVLPDRHPVPRLRRGTAVPLPVGGDRLRATAATRCGRPTFGAVVFVEILVFIATLVDRLRVRLAEGGVPMAMNRLLPDFLVTQARLRWRTWCARTACGRCRSPPPAAASS